MAAEQRQGELGEFADQLLEAAVFLGPLLDLGEEFDGDVSGVGLGFDFPGEVMAGVLVAPGTAAVGIAAGAADRDQAGGQDGPAGLELLLPGLEGAADEGGMLGRIHALIRAI